MIIAIQQPLFLIILTHIYACPLSYSHSVNDPLIGDLLGRPRFTNVNATPNETKKKVVN